MFVKYTTVFGFLFQIQERKWKCVWLYSVFSIYSIYFHQNLLHSFRKKSVLNAVTSVTHSNNFHQRLPSSTRSLHPHLFFCSLWPVVFATHFVMRHRLVARTKPPVRKNEGKTHDHPTPHHLVFTNYVWITLLKQLKLFIDNTRGNSP